VQFHESARRPRPENPGRIFRPDPDELIQALSAAFGLAPPAPPVLPVPSDGSRTLQDASASHEEIGRSADATP
jgi:hypothetical protein